MSENRNELDRAALAQSWIAQITAFRAARKAAMQSKKSASQAERLGAANTWESLFAVVDDVVEVRDEKSLARSKSDRAARLAGVATSAGTPVKIRVADTGGFAEFNARVDPLTGAMTCGPIALYGRITKAHAERELAQGKNVYADESGSYLRINVRGTWGITGKGDVKVFDAETEKWHDAAPSPHTVMAERQSAFKVIVG